jgi:alcohol dehydrogenase class IV
LEQFSCKTKIMAGTGAVAGLASIKARRLFLVTDPYFMKDGTARRVAEAAKA